MTDLAVDYAWTHPNPAAIKAAGYMGVIRYLSTDPTKNITAAEAAALHAAGLGILLVWEAGGQNALGGANQGNVDGTQARVEAGALGYPTWCPVFAAVDFDVQPAQYPAVDAYFAAFAAAAGHPEGDYGSFALLNHMAAADHEVKFYWQTSAWSGTTVSPLAHLYQRLAPTLTVPGAAGSYDENVVLKPLPWWTAAAPQPPAPPPVEDPLAPDIFVAAGNGTVYVINQLLMQRMWIPDPKDGAPYEALYGKPVALSNAALKNYASVGDPGPPIT